MLLRGNAALFAAPGAKAPAIDMRDLGRLADKPHHTRQFRLIADQGEWLTVESMGDASPFDSVGCHATTWSLRGLKLRFHVRRDDVFPVLTKPIELTYNDGTAVTLKPGVAMGATDQPGRRWVHVNGLELVVSVPDEFIGMSYEPENYFDAPALDDADSVFLEPDVYREQALKFANGKAIGPRLPRSVAKNIARVLERVIVIAERGDDRLIELRKNCVKVRALVAAKYVSGSDATMAGILGSLSGFAGFDGVPRAGSGSVTFWRGGRHAGYVMQSFGFHDEVAADGERRCFRISTRNRYIKKADGTRRSQPVRFLELCFHRTAIIE